MIRYSKLMLKSYIKSWDDYQLLMFVLREARLRNMNFHAW